MRYRPTDASKVIARINREGMQIMLTPSEAVAVVAACIAKPHPADRVQLNAVRTRLKRQNIKGDLVPQADGRYRTDDLIRWARSAYGTPAFEDFPTPPTTALVRIRSGVGLSADPESTNLPATLAECYALIREKQREVERLKTEANEREKLRIAGLIGRLAGKKL